MTFGFGTCGEIKVCQPSKEIRAIHSREAEIDRIVAARLEAQKATTLAAEIAAIAERKRLAYNEKRRAYHAANKDRINARRRELRAKARQEVVNYREWLKTPAKKAKLVTLF